MNEVPPGDTQYKSLHGENVGISGGGGTPYDGLYGKAPPERGIFSTLQIYERVGV